MNYANVSYSIIGSLQNSVNGLGPEVLAIPDAKQSPISMIHLPGKHVETVATLFNLLKNFQPSSIYYVYFADLSEHIDISEVSKAESLWASILKYDQL